ncbi:MAG TPA: hypothetical protein DIT64_06055 [Verrucomicrobiales bacterium]|nr:hypothetical protein [Verrucomicrobiales bacterium]
MKNLHHLLLTAMLMAVDAHGQDAPAVKKELRDAAQKLQQAREDGALEKAGDAARQMSEQIPAGVAEAAKSALESSELKKQAVDAANSLLPEARKRMDSGSSGESVGEKGGPAKQQPSGPQPQTLLPLDQAASKPRVPTVVIEADSSVFDLKQAVFVYTGRVRARHPQFYIECDELVVEMENEEDKEKDKSDTQEEKAGSQKKKPGPDDGATQEKKTGNAGVKKATATGSTVTIEKLTEEGETQIGKCRKAVYEAGTGEIIMSNYPQVQRGNILHLATQPDTLMIFDPNGKLRTTGRPRTIILNDEDKSTDTREGGNSGR